MCEVGHLHEGVGREEAPKDGVVEAGVGVDDLEAVVVLVAGEAAAEGERHLRLRGVPGGVAHAVAPGIEVGLLDGVLEIVHHRLPASETVGEHVVEAVGTSVGHVHRHEAALGIDVVEAAGRGGGGLNLILIRNSIA